MQDSLGGYHCIVSQAGLKLLSSLNKSHAYCFTVTYIHCLTTHNNTKCVVKIINIYSFNKYSCNKFILVIFKISITLIEKESDFHTCN